LQEDVDDLTLQGAAFRSGCFKRNRKLEPSHFALNVLWRVPVAAFANPALTLARPATNSFAGISSSSAPLFIGEQLIGGVTATLFVCWLLSKDR
jgi:hypothetical protein